MDYNDVIAECMGEIKRQETPPAYCNYSTACTLAGGCPSCLTTKKG